MEKYLKATLWTFCGLNQKGCLRYSLPPDLFRLNSSYETKMCQTANSDGLINCLGSPDSFVISPQSLWYLTHLNLLNLVVPRLILLPRHSLLGCRPMRSWHKFLQSHLAALSWPQTLRRQPGFVHLQGLSHLAALPWPKTLSRQPGLSHLAALSGHRNFQPSTGTLSGPKRSRPSTGILQKLMPARAAGGN